MSLENLLRYDYLSKLFESALPDFVLAFAFFTAVVYAVLGKRFEHQRSAITMSGCLAFALSIGLVWWEQANGLSIKNLGPIAVGFALLVLAFIMYQSIRQVGGSWAGAGITLGLSLLIAMILGFRPPVDGQIINSIIVVALLIGLIAFLIRQPGHAAPLRFIERSAGPDIANARRDMAALYRDRHLSKRITRRMRQVRKEADLLQEHPEQAGDVLLQIRRMLPAEGYLTEQMAQLRAKAHRIKEGHIVRLEETKHVFQKLPTEMKKRASVELMEGYQKMAGIDIRLERLDRAVAENERRIHELTRQAGIYSANYAFEKLHDCLKTAEKLQQHNTKLFNIIERTEAKLVSLAQKVAQEVQEVDHA